MTKPWREHAKLVGRFHPEFPDDVQVLVHDGGPRLTATAPELVWTRVTGGAEGVFVGNLMNEPRRLSSVTLGSEILFVVPDGLEHPLRVLPQYLADRLRWKVHPCTSCSLAELFDPPSALAEALFPDAEGELDTFSAPCAMCGGIQIVELRTRESLRVPQSQAPPTPSDAPRRSEPWWRRFL